MKYIKFKIMKIHWYIIVFFFEFHSKMLCFHNDKANVFFDRQKRVYEKIHLYLVELYAAEEVNDEN
jgi:hypothetical protein